MAQKLKKHHMDFIKRLLFRHREKGQMALEPHVPDYLKSFVHTRIIDTRNMAKLYCESHHVHKSMVRACEAKIFIEMNPDVVEGLVVGNWTDLIHNIQEEKAS